MIKALICIRRRAGISPEQFRTYWHDVHGALVREVQSELRIVKYVQSHALDNELSEILRAARGAPPLYDGVGEAWFRSLDDLRAVSADPGAQAALARLLQDEARFLDHAQSPFFLAEERPILGS